ncbi:MAG: hypothetical protein ABIP97_13750 [Chthoniobacterales bacterium]
MNSLKTNAKNRVKVIKTVLFICTGNYYRSRLAEILFNHYAIQSGIQWRAESRGLSVQKDLKSISHHALKYLNTLRIIPAISELRDPLALSVDDLDSYDLIVLLNGGEHLVIMETRFSWMVKALQKEGKIRLWHVHDLEVKVHPFLKWIGAARDRVGQPEESAVEHIDFGARALVQELEMLPKQTEEA